MSFTVGMQIGPYRILEPLGQGGMAMVFKAYHAALDRYVALKVLHPALLEDPNFLARFRREARVVAKLDHPNIVPIYDFNEHQGRPYLVMKYIEGETLKARLKRGRLSPEEIRAVVEAVGSALAYAHRQGVLHRDIKPSNVLLSQDGRIYLSDFGLARMAAAGESTLSSDMIMGTPQYISPEQAMGKKDLDARTDIYSFGVMLYEMLVGRVPFLADTPYSIIHDHIYAPLPRPRDLNPQVPESMERVLLKALAKDPEERFASVEEMLRAFRQAWERAPLPTTPTPGEETARVPPPTPSATPLAVEVPSSPEELSAGETVAASPQATQPEAPSPPPRRRRWWGVLLALLGAGVLCLLGVGLFSQARPGTPTRPSPSAFTEVPGQDLPAQDEEVADLLQRIRANPTDPQPYLELALWQYGHHQPGRGEASLTRGLNLCVQQQRLDLLLDYASQFLDLGEPLPATQLLLAAGPLLPEDQRELWNEVFRQSAYWAAEDPGFTRAIPITALNKYDASFAKVLQARYELYNGDPDHGNVLLKQVLRDNKSMPEALLLDAEYAALHAHDPALARRRLETLTSMPEAPRWVLDLAQEWLKTWPTPSP